MRVSYGGIELTGPTASEHAGLVSMPFSNVVSVLPLVRGAVPAISPMGNRSYSVGITCIRRYATILDAMAARASFLASLPDSGALVLSQYSLGATLVVTGAGACLSACPAPVLMGRSVQWAFSFLVGQMAISYVAADNSLLTEEDGVILNEAGSPIMAFTG